MMTVAEAYRILALPAYAYRFPARARAKMEREAEARLRQYVTPYTLARLDGYRAMGKDWKGDGPNHAQLAYMTGLRAEILSIILEEHERLVEGRPGAASARAEEGLVRQ